jgi:probable LLM family oxidoreductase
VLREVIDEAVLADELGLDAFGVGEHHRPDFSISAPEVVLGAIATRTKRLLLGSAVTVLSTDDPVRVYERFSTIDALSNGRAEVILGRGSFTESYPLFGFDVSRYEELFEDRVALFVELLKGGPVTWSGTTRAAVNGATIYPTIENGTLKTWIGVGGSPQSVVRAARYSLPLTLAIIGGSPTRFRPFVDLYLKTLEKLGKPELPIAVHSPGHVAATDEQAKNELWPHYAAMITRIGAERGWPPVTRAQFEREAGPDGALCVGAPATVAAKITHTVRALGLSRFNLKYSAGTLPHASMMKSIELIGKEVAPRVREASVGLQSRS